MTDESRSERRQEQDLLRRVNRHLRVLIECNQAIVHINEEHLLLQEICRIITEVGGYTFAWVGFAIEDEKKSIHPVAFAGKEDGFLKAVNITWADTELGRGPSGTAIRTGKPFVSRDIAEDERFAPWRKEALTRGYHATIGIPLFCEEGICAAVLNIYSAQIDAFDTEEVKLLSELGRDLGYGIKSIRQRQALELSEKEIQEKENFLLNIFTSIQDGISVLDKDFNIIDVNATMEKWYAHAMPLVGKKCYEAYHGQHERCKVCPTYQTLQSGKPACEVVPYTGPGGEILGWLDLYSFPLMDTETGELKGVIEYVRDITERKKAEEALRESEERFRLIARVSNDAIYDWDLTRNVANLSPSHLTLFGYSDTRVGPDWWAEKVHPEDRERVNNSMYEAINSGSQSWTCEYRFQHAEGHYLYIFDRASILRDDKGRPMRLIGAMMDITRRKRAEEKLLEEFSFRNSVIESAAEGIAVCHAVPEFPFVRFTVWNKRMEEITGYSMEEINRKGWYQSVYPDPEYQEKARKRMERMREGDNLVGERWEITRVDGAKRTLEISTNVLVSADGINHVMALMHDVTDIKEAQDKLETAAKDWQQTFDSTKDLIMLLDSEYSIIKANKPTADFLKLPVDSLIGKKCFKLMHGFDKPPDICPINRMIKSKKYEEAEIFMPERNVWIWVSVEPILDKNNNIFRVAHVVRDITERKKAEEALRDSEAKLRIIFDDSLDGILLADAETKRFYIMNKTIGKMLGYAEEELKRLSVNDIHPVKELPKVIEAFEKQVKGEIRIAEDLPVKRKDGSIFYADINASAITLGGKRYLMGSFRDVSDRKKAQEALRESEEKYRLITDNTSDLIAVIKFDGTFVYASPSHERLGYKQEDLVGKSGLEMIHYEDRTKLLPLLAKYAKTKLAEYFKLKSEIGAEYLTFRFPDKTGNWHHLESTANLIKSFTGEGLDILLVSRDVTERKKAEEEMKKHLQELEIFHKASVDRELKMVELKKRIKELEEKLKGT